MMPRTLIGREFRIEGEYDYNRSSPLRWIVSHLMRYPLLPLITVLASIVNNLCYSYVQIFVGRGFDVITSAGWQIIDLLTVTLGVLGSATIQGVTGLIRNFSIEFLAQRIERDSRDELYGNLLGKSQTFHGKQRIGDIMARATNDVRSLNLMFNPGLMLIIDGGLALIVPVILIGTLNVRLLLVPAIFTVLLVVTLTDYARRLKPVSIAQREQFGTMNAGLAESVAGIEVVKSNAQEPYECKRFMHNARLFREYFVRQGMIQARFWPMLVFSVAFAGGFLHGLLLWRAGLVTLGEVIAFMGLMGTLRFSTFISIYSFSLVQLGVASAERILTTINTETELDENRAGLTKTAEGKVVFENVSFSYNAKPVLKNISFTAEPGQTVALVGQTGSGKTTLSRLINRIFEVSSGRVLIDGVDVREWSLESLRSQISTIEQDVFLYSRTVAENIAFGCSEANQQDVERAAKEAQAHEFILRFDDGYDTHVGERGVTLSGGQRQRIAIARAFLCNPKILILDDSTSAIDSATEDLIQQAMRRISSQRTTFIITHRLSQIRWADRILVLRRGELVDCGTHEELMARCADYRRIFARCD
jgi:ATP-binding cassette subfamily B protein